MLAVTTALTPPPTFSPQQQAVINAMLEPRGNVLVVARAGCGKTHLSVAGVVVAVYKARPRDEIVIMAYNKDAGNEIKARLAKLGVDWRRVTAGTCHSFGYSAWNKTAGKAFPDGKVPVNDKKVLQIIDRKAFGDETSHWTRCAGTIRQTVSLAKQNAFGFLTPVGNLQEWYEMIQHHLLDDDLPDGYTIDDLVDWSMEVLNDSIARDYIEIDFDDMILAPLIHKARFWGKDLVIMDEVQDANKARRALAMAMMKPKWGRFMGVGDDRQSIYGFTGADSESMELTRKTLNCRVMPLNVTYRCPKAVVALAQQLVPDFTAHPSAPEGIVRSVQYKSKPSNDNDGRYWYETEGLGYGDVILCRNTKPLVEEAYSLLRAGIGCIVEGREIGKGLINLARKWRSIKNLQALREKLKEYCAREVSKFLAKGQEEKADQIDDRVGTLQAIIDKCLNDGKSTIDELAVAINSLFGDSNDKDQPKVLRLSTIHKSKGREWRRVFMLGRRVFLPSKYARKEWQLLQEDNLEYVGITRAMEEYVDVVMEAA